MICPRIPIGDLVEKVKKWDPRKSRDDVKISYVDIASVDRELKRIVEVANIDAREAPSRARQIIQSGDVLVSTVRPNLNAVAYVEPECDGATASTGFAVLRPNGNKLNGRYLFHWTRTPQFVDFMVEHATGASYPAVSDRIVKGSEIPLPPLPEQRRIAAILDQADAIRRKRQKAIELTEKFLKSAFLEMFGDPVTNPKGWETVELGNISDIQSGVTKGRRFNGKETVHAPYMRVANVQDGRIELDEIKTIEVLPEDVEKYRLLQGDVLLTEGGDFDKLGRGAVWHSEVENCIHQNHIFRVRLSKSKITPEYASALIGSSYGKRYFLRAAKQTTGIATINKRQLVEFPARVPPLKLQREYEALVRKYKIFRSRMESAAGVQNGLFNSLVQRAFRGELSPVEVP